MSGLTSLRSNLSPKGSEIFQAAMGAGTQSFVSRPWNMGDSVSYAVRLDNAHPTVDAIFELRWGTDPTLNTWHRREKVTVPPGGAIVRVHGPCWGTWLQIFGVIGQQAGATTDASYRLYGQNLPLSQSIASRDNALPITSEPNLLDLSLTGLPEVDANILGGTVAVTAPTLTKGVQGATGWSTQDLKDAGRTHVGFQGSVALTTGEGATTMTIQKGTAYTPTTGSSYTVTSGKTLRIVSIVLALVNGAAISTSFRLRLTTAVTGNEIWKGDARLAAAGHLVVPHTFPDGIEFASGTVLQFSDVSSAAGTAPAQLDVSIVGFEY
jgi:hypothetical protein